MANATSENAVGGKKLTELKVVELRSELEKRGLDKTGVKAVLLERLEKALENEGKVPDDYLFAESELKSKKSLGRLSKSATEKEMKDDEEDEEEEDEEESPVATDDSVQQNDSVNMNSNLQVENSNKVTNVASTVDNVEVKNDEQHENTKETQPSPEKQATLNDTNLNNASSKVETNDISADPTALPPQSSSSSAAAGANTKEEDEQNDADKSTTASTQDHTPAASLNEVKEEESQNAVCDILPPTPTSVPCVAPLTLKDTINMDTSTAQQSEENESLIVHVDDTQNDLDADLLTSQTNGLKSRQAAKEKAIGKSEGKKSDPGSGGGGSSGGDNSSPPEVGGESSGEGIGGGGGDKGNLEVKTEKKADEKKDDKDGKLKSSSSVSKLKITKNVKGGSQNSRNLWISGLFSNTHATDLKGLFSKHGKVIGAKLVTNTRSPGAGCYGFITMSSSEEATKCIQHLNQTEFHGKMISVEKAKNEPGTQTVKKTETKPGEKKSDKTEVKKESGSQNSRNLWISGLSSNTRATDLKGLFSKYGKVVGAKVVTNARSPGARCYGFLTMSSSEEASKCIQHLNQTELHGRMISVERAKNEPGTQTIKKPETKPGEKKSEKPEVKKEEKKEGNKKESEKKDTEKKEGEKKEVAKKEEKKETKKDDKDRKSICKRDNKRHSSTSGHRKITDKSRVVVMDKSKGEPVISVKRGSKESGDKNKTSTSKEKVSTVSKSKPKESTESGKDKTKESKKDILSFDQIRISRPSKVKKQLYEYFKAERERERLRQSERRLREEERRRLRELDRARLIQRDVQRRQKEEAFRLERFRERLRMEREKLEREKLERERIKLEREFLERERFRDEQRRAEMLQFEEQRRAMKRSYERSSGHEEGFWNEPKRPNLNAPSTRFDHSFSNESLREVGPGRDRSSDRNHEADRRDLGPDRGRDSDRRNVSAHDRLGRVRNSPAVPPPDQRTPWGSGLDRKVDAWSHPHGNMDNSGVNRPNDRWINNNMAPNHDRGPNSGGGGGPGAGGMVQNMGPGNMFVNPQAQPPAMMVGGGGGGGGNMGGRMPEPRFDAYKHMRRY
ncbi:SAFB-like transcription modulator,Scaffold attachment factor B1,Scaffold attachment factor B2 [Acanthosepion pharaonis]|uniref:SAFB-like transcription modulator,Scaffold attachment factor B1,Scaffold attachment factor B2 n=1 Tax=Acanthosepion pharaonis TaxID=158019 RepID=A0A812E245_ACAPH|nr:SAFB-like transcription modulator,Scaffold attachment factor B1,Scaffold attachment factor B2 [Sepia pharaonis]